MIIHTVVIAIFFLYLVLIGTNLQDLMDCDLQEYMRSSILLRHVMIFLSIYTFSFLLDWYTYDALIVQKFTNNNENNENNENNKNNEFKQKTILNYFYYTALTYIVFLLSTKCSGIYLAIFLIGVIVLLFLQVYGKTIDADKFKEMENEYFITNKYKEYPDLVMVHNLSCLIFTVIMISALLGFYKKFNERYVNNPDLTLVTFLFTNRCMKKN